METVTVTDVSGPNERGWYEVELEDGRVASTKDKNVASEADASSGPITVDIKEKQNGDYPPNVYLNKILGGESPAAPHRGKDMSIVAVDDDGQSANKPTKRIQSTSKREGDKQAAIQSQWAYGRAVELLVGSGEEFTYPLDTDVFAKVQAQATALLLGAKDLASK